MKTTSDLIYLLFSVFLHLALVLVMLFRIFIFPEERPEMIQSVRVDLVALPDKDPVEGPKGAPPPPAAAEKKAEPTPEKPKETAPPKEENVFVEKKKDKDKEKKPKEDDKKKTADTKKTESKEKVKDQQNAALDRLKALAKIKEMKNKKDADAAKGEGEGQQYKGNVLSEGNSLTGVEKLQHDQYLGKLDSHIKNNWKLPAWLTNKSYATAVLVRFDEKGLVLEKKVIRSSGNAAFDSEAMQAIANSVPFPEPPEHLVSYFKVRGIELRFPE